MGPRRQTWKLLLSVSVSCSSAKRPVPFKFSEKTFCVDANNGSLRPAACVCAAQSTRA